MCKLSKRARHERTAATRRPPEGAWLEPYEATVMYLAAARVLEAYTKHAGKPQRPRRTRT